LAERGGGESWTRWIPFVDSEKKKESNKVLNGEIKEKLSSLVEKLKPSSTSDSKSADTSEVHSDHEGEAGWIGSGVWGLSAVGQKQRQADRDRDTKVAGGHEVEDDGGKRQRQIEWEGFLRYADQKERGEAERVHLYIARLPSDHIFSPFPRLSELYNIFTELDKNSDMRLDVNEINSALDRAGIELARPALEDFITSLGSSSHYQGSSCPTSISFPEFRDYLLLLPRNPSVNEVSLRTGFCQPR
jgi:solute carrier family 25 phosphate transporter 23/24/25/41